MDNESYYTNNLEDYSAGIEYLAVGSTAEANYRQIPSGSGSDKSAFTRGGYEKSRIEDALPKSHRDIVIACDNAYYEMGLIRNMIDLMGDFVVQGLELSHPSPNIEAFYQNWFTRIKGVDVSERIANTLYRCAAVPIRRRLAKLSAKDVRRIKQAKAATDIIEVEHIKQLRNVVPWEYIILNPATIKLIGGCAATFGNKLHYAIDIPKTFGSNFLDKEEEKLYKETIRSLPEEIRRSINETKSIPLDPENTIVLHYKKDDWQQWATPIIYSVLYNVRIMQKMYLADMSALDGAIDNLRIVKIGDLEHKIMPGPKAFQKLATALATNTGAGIKDVVWGPDIDVIETKNDTYKFLGDDKYIPHKNAIYAGLGIPPTLTGTDKSSGTTNNLVSLKTLIERLQYGRQKLTEFWNGELEMIRQAMGHKEAATLQFAHANLGDEEAEKKLWIELAERNIISDEALLKRFGINPRIEKMRVRKEERAREKGTKPPKVSPYHNPQLKEIEALKVTPTTPTDTKTGQLGRPKNSRDTQPRKQRAVTPVVKATIRIWAEDAQQKIFDYTKDGILEWFSKKNLRSLTIAQAQEAENMRLSTLFNIEPNVTITKEVVAAAISKPIDTHILNQYNQFIQDIKASTNTDLSLVDIRKLQIEFYVDYCVNYNRE